MEGFIWLVYYIKAVWGATAQDSGERNGELLGKNEKKKKRIHHIHEGN